jgi:hypothetical protein
VQPKLWRPIHASEKSLLEKSLVVLELHGQHSRAMQVISRCLGLFPHIGLQAATHSQRVTSLHTGAFIHIFSLPCLHVTLSPPLFSLVFDTVERLTRDTKSHKSSAVELNHGENPQSSNHSTLRKCLQPPALSYCYPNPRCTPIAVCTTGMKKHLRKAYTAEMVSLTELQNIGKQVATRPV